MTYKTNRHVALLLVMTFAICFLANTPGNSEIVININQTTLNRIHDTNADGLGNSVFGSPANNLVGYFDNAAVENMHMVWVFQMTGTADGSLISDADFQVDQTGIGNGLAFDVDAHVVRTSNTSTILASDYQDSASLMMESFDGAASVGLRSLDAGGKTSLTSFLQSNWVENEFVFISLKTDPVTLSGVNNFYRYATSAQLSVTVPEPSTIVMFGLGLSGLVIRRRSNVVVH